MSTLNLSFFKKNLMGTEACSASLTTEFLDVFSETELENKMLKVLGTIKSSVEVQVNCKIIDCTPVIECKAIPVQATADNKHYKCNPKIAVETKDKLPPTERQLNALKVIASKQNITPDEFVKNQGFNQMSELTGKDCWNLINKMKDI